MSWFGDIFHKVMGIFRGVRDETTKYLADHHDEILAAMKKLYENDFRGRPLIEWRDEAFKLVGDAIGHLESDPGTALTVGINLAYDILKNGKA